MGRRIELAARQALLSRRRTLLRLLTARTRGDRALELCAPNDGTVMRFGDAGKLGAVSIALYRTLAEIAAAIERIDRGCYGVCTDCGRSISPPRLEAVPWLSRCDECCSKMFRE